MPHQLTRGEVVVLLGTLLTALAVGLTSQGCRNKGDADSASATPKDPLAGSEPVTCACSDGSIYLVGEDGHVYWLVKGKALKVACDDQFSPWGEGGEFFADAEGGVYAVGEQHLWYMKTGKPIQVKQATESEAVPEARAVTERTLMWSALSRYGKAAYRAAHNAGYQSGYDAGLQEHRESMRGESN